MLPIRGTVLDIGSEDGSHACYMKSRGLDVLTLDARHNADICATWPIELNFQVGAIWCSHTLEHSRNPGAFLDAINKVLILGGWLAITVPPAKNAIVGGHLSIWNAGLLLYHLIMAGFDCRDAKLKTYDYNISVIVKHRRIELPHLNYDNGDIDLLAQFFPLSVAQGFNGIIEGLHWV